MSLLLMVEGRRFSLTPSEDCFLNVPQSSSSGLTGNFPVLTMMFTSQVYKHLYLFLAPQGIIRYITVS